MISTWQNPIWLDSNVADFKRHARTRFRQDSFIEHIEFDYLEIQVIGKISPCRFIKKSCPTVGLSVSPLCPRQIFILLTCSDTWL